MAFEVVLPSALTWRLALTNRESLRATSRSSPNWRASSTAVRTCGVTSQEHSVGATSTADQEETFVVLAGALTMYLRQPPERHDVPVGGLVHVSAGTPLQTANHGDLDLLVYAYGSPPDDGADVLGSAL